MQIYPKVFDKNNAGEPATFACSPVFVGKMCLFSLRLCFGRLDVDEFAAFFAFCEDNNTVDEGEESVILAHANVETRVVYGATLTLDDVTGFAMLTTENLYSESFAF